MPIGCRMRSYQPSKYALLSEKPVKGLPRIFSEFFSKAYQQGTISQCVGILVLLHTHSLADITIAIELTMAYDLYHVEGISNILTQLKTNQPIMQKLTGFTRPDLSDVTVPLVDLSRYDTLTSQTNIRETCNGLSDFGHDPG